KEPLLQPASTVTATEPRHSSLSIWISISLLLLILYIVYRRRQNKSDDDTEKDEQTAAAIDENISTRDQSEYRLSAVPALPTIVEENPITLTPSNSN
ncbi:unnamed protein product, partial [Rotaria socialis]